MAYLFHGIGSSREVPRDATGAPERRRQPVGALLLEGIGPGVCLQALGPLFERGCRGRQLHGPPLAQLLVGGLEILEEDIPREFIYEEMMGKDEQIVRRVRPEVEQG